MSKVKVHHHGHEFDVTAEQKQAYEALPEEVRKNLRPPRVSHHVMTDEEFEALKDGRMSTGTVMCPW